MAFWGKILKSGEPYTLHSDGGSRRLRLTQATLVDLRGTDVQPVFRSIVCYTVGNGESIVLCRLQSKHELYRCSLDLELEESEDVVFSLDGERPIHLAGYFIRPPMTTINTTITCSCKAPSNRKQADIEKNRRDDCSNNDPSDTFIAGCSIPENLPPIGARVEEFDNDKRIDGKQVGEELVNSSDASQLQLICTEKNSKVEKFDLLVECPQIGEQLESDLIKDNDKEPHKIDFVIRDENTTGELYQETERSNMEMVNMRINNVIAAMTENEEIQPDTIEINNVIAATTENEKIQPHTMESYNFNAVMTESGGIVPDSEDNSDNVAGNASSGNHVLLRKQKIKKSIVEHDKVMFESIGTNMKEESNMYTIGCIQKDSLPNDSEILPIEGGEVSTRNHSKSKKKKTNRNNMLDKEFSQIINNERKKIEVEDEKIISAKSEGKSCSSSNGKDDKGIDGLYLKGAKDAGLEDGKIKCGVMTGYNSCKSGDCPIEDGTRNLNGRTDNEGNEDGTIKVGFCNTGNNTQKEMLENDNSEHIALTEAQPHCRLKRPIQSGVDNRQVVDSSVPKEKGKQKKTKLKTSKIYDKSTTTETITVLALPAYLENSKPVADTSAHKEKGKLKKRKLETSLVPKKSTMTETSFRSTVLALPQI